VHGGPRVWKGGLVEDLIRSPDAPNGTSESLVDAAMRDAAATGSRWATLGLVPLAGPISPWLQLAKRWAAAFYDFEGLRAFRARLRPVGWDPIYLSYPAETRTWRVVIDALRAFARGSLVRFGLATLWRTLEAAVRS
jgi:phosphatidylglycerol lysyltransferase